MLAGDPYFEGTTGTSQLITPFYLLRDLPEINARDIDRRPLDHFTVGYKP